MYLQKVLKKYRASFNTMNGHINLPVRNTVNEAFVDYKKYINFATSIHYFIYSNAKYECCCYARYSKKLLR